MQPHATSCNSSGCMEKHFDVKGIGMYATPCNSIFPQTVAWVRGCVQVIYFKYFKLHSCIIIVNTEKQRKNGCNPLLDLELHGVASLRGAS